MRNRVDQLIDRTRSARHDDSEYYSSINAAIIQIVKDRVAPIRIPRKYSVQSAQRIRDELYTLVPAAVTGAPTGNDVIRPADYMYMLLLYATISSEVNYCRPTTYNQVGLLASNPFKKPSTVKPYYNEYTTGIKIDFGPTGTFSAYELWYVKNPATVSIGFERDKLFGGTTLTNTIIYYVYEDAVYNGVTYYPGETILGTGAVLTSGTILITTKVVNCDLPVNMHDEVCYKAAALLEGTVEAFGKKQDLNIETEKS